MFYPLKLIKKWIRISQRRQKLKSQDMKYCGVQFHSLFQHIQNVFKNYVSQTQ